MSVELTAQERELQAARRKLVRLLEDTFTKSTRSLLEGVVRNIDAELRALEAGK